MEKGALPASFLTEIWTEGGLRFEFILSGWSPFCIESYSQPDGQSVSQPASQWCSHWVQLIGQSNRQNSVIQPTSQLGRWPVSHWSNLADNQDRQPIEQVNQLTNHQWCWFAILHSNFRLGQLISWWAINSTTGHPAVSESDSHLVSWTVGN